MKKIIIICLILFFIPLMAVSVGDKEQQWTLVVIPDTQSFISTTSDDYFENQAQWIADRTDYVDFVLHVGDIVEHDGSGTEWQKARDAFDRFDDDVPTLTIPGNHDYNDGFDLTPGDRDLTDYYSYFPMPTEEDWWGGYSGDNIYAFYEGAGYDWLILGLEYFPSDATIAWADGFLDDYDATHKVIIFTHAYLNHDGTPLTDGTDKFSADDYTACGGAGVCNDGDVLYSDLISNHSNIVLVLSGHIYVWPSGAVGNAYKVDGDTHQFLQNWQTTHNYPVDRPQIRIFKILKDEIQVNTFSTIDNQYLLDSDNCMRITY